jgi:F-type H+-transporting ATPase subunit epsilon
MHSYNRYISVASRVVRRSLKEDKRIAAERRGESELRFAKWEVSLQRVGAWRRGQ